MRLFSLISLFVVLYSFAQTNIETPNGFDKIHVNMSADALVKEMGPPTEVRDFKDEEKIWVDGGYHTDRSMAFVIGFDEVYIFDYNNKYCLWKAYVKNNQVIYMNLVTRFTREEFRKNITVRNKLHFHDSIEKVEQEMGKNFFPDRGFGYTDYLYHDLGIRFTFKQNRMVNIYLYRRLDNRADLYRVVKWFPKDI
jgi:hypothetical protein